MRSAGDSRTGREPGVVHLHVAPSHDDDATALREQLAGCLAGDVTEVRVHVDPAAEPSLAALRSLALVADALAARGGRLALLGGSRRLVTRLRTFGFERLLPVGAAAARRTLGGTSARRSAPGA